MLALKIQGGEGFILVSAAEALSFRGLVRLLPTEGAPDVFYSRNTVKHRLELTEAGWALLGEQSPRPPAE